MCGFVVWKRKDVQDKDRIELYEKRFPVLFEELKKGKWTMWIGCFIYVARRAAFGFSLLFKFDPELQLVIQAVFTVNVIVK